MPIKVNQELCIGCGACESLCPGTFKLSADGKSEPISQEVNDCAKSAVNSCPGQAITAE